MSEEREQMAVFEWVAWCEKKYPELKLMYHVPNGGSRHIAEAVKLKKMGVKAGVSDICLPVARNGYNGLYVELKVGKGRLTDAQRDFLVAVAKQGYRAAEAHGADEAITIIQEYLRG